MFRISIFSVRYDIFFFFPPLSLARWKKKKKIYSRRRLLSHTQRRLAQRSLLAIQCMSLCDRIPPRCDSRQRRRRRSTHTRLVGSRRARDVVCEAPIRQTSSCRSRCFSVFFFFAVDDENLDPPNIDINMYRYTHAHAGQFTYFTHSLSCHEKPPHPFSTEYSTDCVVRAF